MREQLKSLLTSCAALAVAGSAFGQVEQGQQGLLQQARQAAGQGVSAPTSPADFHNYRFAQPEVVQGEPGLPSPLGEPTGNYTNFETGPGGGLDWNGQAGDHANFVDQQPDCTTGWFSNTTNTNPFLVFDDFIADGSTLNSVTFHGGVYNLNTGSNGSLGELSSIFVEIREIVAGGECGWAYGSRITIEDFTIGDLNPQFICSAGGFYDSYALTATFSSPIALNNGQNYMIIVGGRPVDQNGPYLFTWTQSQTTNYNASTSWDRTNDSYIRCGPDVAFTTNPSTGDDCFENDCNTTCWFSNFTNNTNPYISTDDFVAQANGDLTQLQFTGGVYDTTTGTGAGLGNIGGFYIEVYTIVADANGVCDSSLTGFLGSYTVSMADARPMFDCTDIFGIPHYQFTVSIPGGTYPLAAGTEYALGVYGIPVDPNSTELFCWGGTDTVYGLQSYSFNLDTGVRDICHDVDQAFCINGARPCLGDYNGDGTLNTLDVLAFLNDWTAQHPAADINGDGAINTLDVITFLNRWTAGC